MEDSDVAADSTPQASAVSSEQQEPDGIQALRASWLFAAVVQFSRLFAAELRLRTFSADLLEESLLSPDDHRVFLADFVYKLVRTDSDKPVQEKDVELWEQLLHRKVAVHWKEAFKANPLFDRTFFDIAPQQRVSCEHFACVLDLEHRSLR